MSKSNKSIFVCKLECSGNGSTLRTKFVSNKELNRLRRKQENNNQSTLYFGEHDRVQEFAYDTAKSIKTLFLFAACPKYINPNTSTALHMIHPHFPSKPLRIFIKPRVEITVDVMDYDYSTGKAIDGKLFRTVKRWKWGNLPDPYEGFAVAVFRRTRGGKDKYRFKIHCHETTDDMAQANNDPIIIGNPSELNRIHRQPHKIGIPEYTPSGKVRVKWVTIKSVAIIISSTSSAVE